MSYTPVLYNVTGAYDSIAIHQNRLLHAPTQSNQGEPH